MKKEWKGVLSVLQGEKTDTSCYDWHYAIGFLLLHRIGVPFLLAARRTGTVIPYQAESILSDVYERQKKRNEVIRNWIADCASELESSGAKFSFLKGSVLSYCPFGETPLYEWGERSSNDIDILVLPEEIGVVDRALSALGFMQGQWNSERQKVIAFSRKEIICRRMTRGETAPYLVATESENVPFVEVDVNYSLGYQPEKDKRVVLLLLSDRAEYPFYGGKITSLSRESFFLHLIMHQYKEATLYWMVRRNKDSLIYKYLDIYRLFERGINEEIFLNLLQTEELRIAAFYVLYFCKKLFPTMKCDKLIRTLGGIGKDCLGSVYDAESKTEFCWTKGIYERTGVYEREQYLRKM